MPILEEEGSELLVIDGLVRVDSRVADVDEPVVAESVGEFGGGAVLFVEVKGPVAVGGELAPARISIRPRSA